jgi:hypothetical protein
MRADEKGDQMDQGEKPGLREDEIPDPSGRADVRMRYACRLIRALRKVTYELRGPRAERPKGSEKKAPEAWLDAPNPTP